MAKKTSQKTVETLQRDEASRKNTWTFFPQRAVERLDDGVVRRFSRPEILRHNAVGVGPEVDEAAGKLTPVVAVVPFRCTAFGGDPSENVDPIGTPQA